MIGLMRPSVPVRLCAGLLLVVLLGACSDGEGGGRPDDGDATPSAAATSDPGGPGHEGDDGESAPTPDSRPEAEVVCEPFREMVTALEEIDYRNADPDEIVDAIAPVMKAWAEEMPHLERPPGMEAETWKVLEVLSARVRALPDDPSLDDLEAVERGLTPVQSKEIDAAAAWYEEHCGLR